MSKAPSLKDFSLQPSPPANSDNSSTTPNNNTQEVTSTAPITIVDFATAWQRYTDGVKNTNKRILISLFEKVEPNYDGTATFTLVVPNNVVADRLEDERQDMMIFLRQNTGINALTMVVDVQQTETEITPYTNREKFDSMAQKNPKLIDLKNALDLEIE